MRAWVVREEVHANAAQRVDAPAWVPIRGGKVTPPELVGECWEGARNDRAACIVEDLDLEGQRSATV